jgi:DNA-binding response OmpR family regulator
MRSEAALSRVPILLLYGESSLYDKNRARKVGATGEIAKPFYCNELLSKLKQALR